MLKRKKSKDINEVNISINNLNGTFQIMAINLVVPFAAMFAKRLDASDFQVALLSSLPAIVSICFIIPGAIFIQRCKYKKNITGKFFIAARIFYLLFALVPLLAREYRATMFVLLYGFMNLPGSIALASWQSYIAGLFPPSMRARVLALRNSLSTLIGVLTTLIAGWLLYNIPKNNEQRILLYQIFFITAFIFAIVEIILFYKHKEPETNECIIILEPSADIIKAGKIKNALLELKSNKKFLTYCICAVIFHFSWYMAWPLVPLYEIDILHSNESWASLIAALNAVCAAVSYIYWGKLINKRGNSFALTIAATCMVIVPFCYPFSRSLFILLPINAIGGAATAGINLIVLNTLYELSPDKSRTLYIAYFNTMLNIVLAIAPFAGVALKNTFNIYNAFIIIGLCRVFAGIILYVRYRNEKRIRI